jgi:hypothetical protein
MKARIPISQYAARLERNPGASAKSDREAARSEQNQNSQARKNSDGQFFSQHPWLFATKSYEPVNPVKLKIVGF